MPWEKKTRLAYDWKSNARIQHRIVNSKDVQFEKEIHSGGNVLRSEELGDTV